MNIRKLSTILFLMLFGFANAQDDLMKELDSDSSKKEPVSAAFKGLQIANMQSTKLPAKKEWYFLVSHRFGDLTNGINNFFGLDNANTKIGGVYGVTDWLSLSASRHTFQKTYELAAKYRIMSQQENGFPVTIVGYNTVDARTDVTKKLYPDITFSNHLAYSTQLLVSRKFSENFSAQLAPMFIHKNLYDAIYDQKNYVMMGAGMRYKISKRVSINADYAARLNLPDEYSGIYHNPFSIGMDIDTGGHIFQMLFSNCQAMNDVSYYTLAPGINGGKGIFFGFNLYRVF